MSPEKEAKENILTLRAGNALLEIIPEVGGSITRYCLVRSEEHTSELQSRTNLVCRLLLEKKKKKKQHQRTTKS